MVSIIQTRQQDYDNTLAANQPLPELTSVNIVDVRDFDPDTGEASPWRLPTDPLPSDSKDDV